MEGEMRWHIAQLTSHIQWKGGGRWKTSCIAQLTALTANGCDGKWQTSCVAQLTAHRQWERCIAQLTSHAVEGVGRWQTSCIAQLTSHGRWKGREMIHDIHTTQHTGNGRMGKGPSVDAHRNFNVPWVTDPTIQPTTVTSVNSFRTKFV